MIEQDRAALVRSALDFAPTQLYVDGTWREASSGGHFEVINPATGAVLTQVADAVVGDGASALDAAVRAQQDWARTAPRQRAELLRAAFERVLELRDVFATLMTLEMGKPLAESYGEVTYGAEFLRWFSEEAVRINGRYTTAPEGHLRILTLQRPVGPSLFITPWNFPLAMATRKIAPALAAGCTTILKPAALTPLTALAFARVCDEVGIPAGVVNVLPTSRSHQLTAPLLADSRLRKLSFTGSTPTGVALLKEAAPNVLRTSMELGGLAPFIVFEDADLDAAVAAALATKTRNMGEACNAANRFYVQRAVAQEFSERLAHAFSSLTVGDGMDPDTQIGPIVSAGQRERIARLMAESLGAGGRVVVGGAELDGPGYFFAPTVVCDLPPSAPLVTDEIFGPVAPVVAFDTEEQAVAWANDTPMGLQGYVHTGSLDRALRMTERLEVGMLSVNTGTISNAAAPFGGVKHSGLGREGGSEGIHEFLETVYVGLPSPLPGH